MNLKTKQKGFTLVELLIVIVVIAILAAISIVAYNGIQNRAKTTSAAASAATVVKKAEAANAIKASYPTALTGTGGFSEQTDSDLAGSGIQLIATTSLTSSATPNQVTYEKCTGTGAPNIARVQSWSYTSNAKAAYNYLGAADGSACTGSGITWTAVTSTTAL